ncbi:MAG: LicD family protein [Bacteroidaceae bacterium]|nr:LicD family protein [Bacteroidaceae bacterium]
MASYDIRPLQLRLLDILLVIQQMCEAHGLRYYLADGSLIGAVREKGFIPWDDDMDICMPRPDYELLIQHSKEWLPERYEFVCFENDATYPLHFGKVQDRESTLVERPHLYYLGGVYVDVFPIDGAPQKMLARRWWNVRYQFLRKMLYFSYRDPYRHGHGASSWVPLLARKIQPMAGWQKAVKRCMMEYRFEECELVSFNHNDGLGAMIDKETVLGNPTPVEFENKQVWGLKNNDAYLTQLFGDYMTPPPANKIHQHNFFYMNLDEPYRCFDKGKLQK